MNKQIYTYKDRKYVIIGFPRIKNILRQWTSAILYHPINDPDNQYVRPRDEFFERFKRSTD